MKTQQQLVPLQLALSHVPLQVASQTPSLQVMFAGHAFPQIPQFASSVCRSTSQPSVAAPIQISTWRAPTHPAQSNPSAGSCRLSSRKTVGGRSQSPSAPLQGMGSFNALTLPNTHP